MRDSRTKLDFHFCGDDSLTGFILVRSKKRKVKHRIVIIYIVCCIIAKDIKKNIAFYFILL